MKSDFPAFYKIAQRTLNATVVCIMGWFNVAWGESRNLFVYDDSLTSFTWNTMNACFVDETGTSVAFSTGDNVSFSFSEDATIWLSEDIHVGTLNLNSSGQLSIYTGSYALNADRIELSGLVTMDSALHIDAGTSLAISDGARLDAPLVLGENGELIVNGTARLSSTTLTLQGGAKLSLPIMGNERVHTLFKGISMVLDAEGNDLFMSTSSISAAEYFEVSYPGAEFWVDATLQFTHGTLQLVRQNDWYKAAEVVTSRQTAPVEYRNYTRVVYEQIESGAESQGIFGYGGALYCPDTKTCVFSDNGSIIFKANSSVSEVSPKGGGIYVGLDSRIEFSGNGRVEFCNNSASGAMADGGAVYLAQGSEIVLENNDDVIFSENQVSGYGGAVYGYNCDIVLAMNDIVEFCKNSAISEVDHCMGGAIYAGGDGAIRLENNGRVTFDENRCSSRYNAIGGAIHGEGGIWLSKNDCVSFTANCSGEDGGAISTFGELYINNNGSVAFSENVSGYDGGAISGQTVELCDNQSVTFDKNSASGEFNNGGGVSAYEVLVNDNRSVIFIDNYAGGDGGGISSAPPNYQIQELIFFHNNDSITFSGNIAGNSGGAIQSDIVTMTGNGSIEFIKNAALGSTGGAIDASNVSDTAHSITVCDNDMVVFRGNTASYNGGAIVVSDQLIICNNDSILFEKNAEIYGGNYHLKSVHVDGGSHVSFSAPESKCFEFRDSLYIEADSLVKYNEVFVNAEGDAIHQTGDIIFTGKYTELHLNEILEAAGAGRTATDEEVLNSRTTKVKAMTNLYGGRLRVEDGAIYQGRGIMVHEGSGATVRVKDAKLSHSGYDLTFNAGTTLELAGTNSITGNVQMLEGSTMRLIDATVNGAEIPLTFNAGTTLELAGTNSITGNVQMEKGSILSFTYGEGMRENAAMTLSGDLSLNGYWTMRLNGFNEVGGYLLITVNDAVVNGWDENFPTLSTPTRELIDPDHLRWVDDNLYYINAYYPGVSMTSWTNSSGSGVWDNQTQNWEFDGTAHSSTLMMNVSFGANEGEQVRLKGDLLVNGLSVEQGGQYAFVEDAAGASLRVHGTMRIQDGASVDIQLTEGVQVDEYLHVDGELKVNKMTGAGKVVVSGGILELADDTDALAVDGNVSISNAELRGSWTGTGLSIGGSRVAQGATVVLKDVTLTSTLSNEGSLSFGGVVAVQADGLVSASSSTKYSAGESGYRYEEKAYTLVTGCGTSAAQDGTVWNLGGDENALANASYSYADGILTATGAQDLSAYWVNGAVNYDGRSEFDSATTLVLNGGNLTMSQGLGTNLTGGIRVDKSSTLTLGNGVEVQKTTISGATASNKVTLEGSGKLNMGASADLTGYKLGTGWTGTVKLAGITSNTNLHLDTIGQAGSTIELENALGYTGAQDKTVAANLVLNKSTAADGTEQAAFLVSDGYSSTSEGYVMTTFSGAVSGAGKMVFDKTLSSEYTGFKFIGNVKDWTGSFEMNAGKTFNLVFGGNATEIKADIRDVSTGSTLNLVLGADAAMTLSGAIDTDSITVSNAAGASFCNTVSTGTLSAAGSAVTFGAAATVSGDMSATAVVLKQGSSLDVGGALSTGQVTLKELSTTAPTLTVGSFVAGDTIFTLDVDALNALNLGHGQSVVIARADTAIGSDFAAWLAEDSTSLDAVVYRYDLSVSGADVMVSMDYANWGTRIWYGNAWVGKESWKEYMTAGHDAVNDVENVDLGGADIVADGLYIAPESSSITTVLSNGMITAEYTEVANGKLTIAEDVVLETPELAADGREILLQGKLIVSGDGSIGQLSGTEGTLEIDGTLRVDSDVTLGSLVNGGTLDMGSHKLNVAGACRDVGNVTAGEVVMHNRTNNYVEFDTLIADKVTVTNTSSSASYSDNISVGDGSAIGELVAEKLQVREGTATLGSTAKQTEQELQSIALQKGADLVLQGQTSLSVTDSVAMTAGAEVQIQSGARLQNRAIALSAAPGTAAATLSSKAGGDLVVMLQDAQFCIQDMLLVNTSIGAEQGTSVMLAGVQDSRNVHLQGGGDFALTFANNKAEVGMAVIENSSPVSGLTLSAGSSLTLVMDPSNNLFADYSLIINMTGFEYEGGNLAAAGGITELNAAGIYLGGWLGQLLAVQGVAQESAGALEAPVVTGDSVPSISYTYSTENNVGMVISISGLSVPEPTTTTLSLLALAALAACRRRK